MAGVFTGGSLLYGSTGRPDLLGPENTAALAHAQYASARRLARELPDQAEIFPTHGFGSFCSATQAQGLASTIGREKRFNPVLTLDERIYLETLIAGLDAWPAYYVHMGPANTAGPAASDLSPPRQADAAEVRRRIRAASGWSTCVTVSPSPRDSCPARSASRSTAASPATWAGLSVGHSRDAAGRHARARQPGAAGAGQDRDRPPGGCRDRKSEDWAGGQPLAC